jgi:hypothetical protein
VLKLKYMSNYANSGPENQRRRDFIIKSAEVVVAVGLLAIFGNRFMNEEEKLNATHEYFKNKEKDFGKAKEAAEMLIQEMENTEPKLERIKILGKHPNNRIEILRTFLTSHIDSHNGSKYPFKNSLIISGYYTKENLEAIIEKATMLA